MHLTCLCLQLVSLDTPYSAFNSLECLLASVYMVLAMPMEALAEVEVAEAVVFGRRQRPLRFRSHRRHIPAPARVSVVVVVVVAVLDDAVADVAGDLLRDTLLIASLELFQPLSLLLLQLLFLLLLLLLRVLLLVLLLLLLLLLPSLLLRSLAVVVMVVVVVILIVVVALLLTLRLFHVLLHLLCPWKRCKLSQRKAATSL